MIDDPRTSVQWQCDVTVTQLVREGAVRGEETRKFENLSSVGAQITSELPSRVHWSLRDPTTQITISSKQKYSRPADITKTYYNNWKYTLELRNDESTISATVWLDHYEGIWNLLGGGNARQINREVVCAGMTRIY